MSCMLELPGTWSRLGRVAELHVRPCVDRCGGGAFMRTRVPRASSRGAFFRVSRQRRSDRGTALGRRRMPVIAFMMRETHAGRNLISRRLRA